jgi:hypothetical protein
LGTLIPKGLDEGVRGSAPLRRKTLGPDEPHFIPEEESFSLEGPERDRLELDFG